MRHPLLLIALLSCAGIAASGCAPALPRGDTAAAAMELPGLGPSGKRLEGSYRATEMSCRVEERRLAETVSTREKTRRIAEALLALGAGGLAVASAVYAAVDPNPKGYVVVPLSAGAAAGTVPIGVLLLADGGAPEVREREERIHDRRLAVRDAYHQLAEATGDRERAEIALDEIKTQLDPTRGAEQGASLRGDGRAAIVDAHRAEVAYAQQRERDAERALAEALQRLGEICGRAAP